MALQMRGRRSKLLSNLSMTFVAIFALVAQPLVALNLPAAFAASNLYSAQNEEANKDTPYTSGEIDISKHENLEFSFTYDSKELDSSPYADSFTYDFLADGTSVKTDTIPGESGKDNETSTISLEPRFLDGADTTQLNVSVDANTGTDVVKLVSVQLTGDEKQSNSAPTIVSTSPANNGDTIYKSDGPHEVTVEVSDPDGIDDITAVKWELFKNGARLTSSEREASPFVQNGNTWSGSYDIAVNANSYDIKFTVIDTTNEPVEKFISIWIKDTRPATAVKNTRNGEMFTTIQEAIDDSNTADDDTIEVSAGTYNEDVRINKSINLVAPNGATINGQSAQYAVELKGNLNGVNISGFTVNGSGDQEALKIETGSTSNDITVQDNSFVSGNGGHAVYAGNVTNSKFINNTFKIDNGEPTILVYLTGGASDSVDFTGNTFSGDLGNHLAFSTSAGNSVFSGNDFSDITAAGKEKLVEISGAPVDASAGGNTYPGGWASVNAETSSFKGVYRIQKAVDEASSGDTVALTSDITLTSDVDIVESKAGLTIDGKGYTVTAPFVKSDDNNSAFSGLNVSNLSIKNMILDGAGSTELHGLNLFKGTGLVVDGLTIKNFQYGILANGSKVTVNSLTTSGNTWAAMSVAQSSTGNSAEIVATGTMKHDETQSFGQESLLAHVYVPDTSKPTTFVDQESQYDKRTSGNRAAYTLKKADTTNPVITDKTPGDNARIGGGNTTISATVTDDTELDEDSVYVNFNLKSGEKSYRLTKEDGSNTYSATINTKEIQPKGVSEPFSISFRAEDVAGNNRSSKSQNVVIDNSGPSISAKTPAEGATIGGSSYTASAIVKDDAGVKEDSVYVRFRDDAGKEYTTYLKKQNNEGLYSAEIDTTKIGNGSTGANRVSFRAVDNLGNPRSSVSENVQIDNAKPVIDNVQPEDGTFINGTERRITVDVTDQSGVKSVNLFLYKQNDNATNDRFQFAMTKGDNDQWYADVNTTELAGDGEYQLVLTAKADGGNNKTQRYNANQRYHQLTVDNAAPRVSNVEIIIGQDDDTGNIGGTVTVAFNMEDANEPDASRTRVIFGNTKTVDDNHKRESVKNPVYNEDTGKYEATFNTKSFVSANHTGTYTLGINPYDELGNQTSIKPEAFRNLLVDNSGPGFRLVSPKSGTAVNGEVTVVFEANDHTGVSGGYARLVNESGKTARQQNIQPGDNGTWTATFDTDGLSDGTYTIDVRPKDTFGTARYNKNRGMIVVDNAKPAVSVKSPANGDVLATGTFTVEGTASDSQTSVERVEYTVNEIDSIGGDWKANGPTDTASGTSAWNFNVEDLPDGFYRLRVQAFDEAGNHKYDYNDIEIDTVAPDAPELTAVGLESGDVTNDSDITLEWNKPSSDTVGYEYFYWNNSTDSRWSKDNKWTTDVEGERYPGKFTEGEGTHYMQVRAVDEAGNVSDPSNTFVVTFDNTAPDASISTTPSTNNGETVSDPVQVTGSVDEEVNIKSHWFEIIDPNGDKTYEYDMNTTDKSYSFTLDTSAGDGEYVIRYVATDRAGNRSDNNSPTVRTVTVENEIAGGDDGSTSDNNGNDEGTVDEGDDTSTTGGVNGSRPTIAITPLQQDAGQQPPLAFLGNDAGAQAGSDSATDDDGEVLATEDNQQNGEVTRDAAASEVLGDEDENGCFKIFGLCWYWWIPIVAAVAAVIWLIKKLRDEDNSVDGNARKLS